MATVPDSPPPSFLKRHGLRLALAATFLGLAAAFYLAGWHRHFRWEALRGRLDQLEAHVQEHLFLSIVIFAAAYVAVTALSLPVATWTSLIGGALFGRWLGTGVVSVSATVGATLAFLSSRYMFREIVQRRFAARLAAFEEGLERDGAFYVLFLRLVPVFPFFLVNLGLGLTGVRLRMYVLMSWLGMLPATFLFVNAGTTIREIERPGDVLSWKVILSFSALGLAPLLLRWAFRSWRRRRTGRRDRPNREASSA